MQTRSSGSAHHAGPLDEISSILLHSISDSARVDKYDRLCGLFVHLADLLDDAFLDIRVHLWLMKALLDALQRDRRLERLVGYFSCQTRVMISAAHHIECDVVLPLAKSVGNVRYVGKHLVKAVLMTRSISSLASLEPALKFPLVRLA